MFIMSSVSEEKALPKKTTKIIYQNSRSSPATVTKQARNKPKKMPAPQVIDSADYLEPHLKPQFPTENPRKNKTSKSPSHPLTQSFRLCSTDVQGPIKPEKKIKRKPKVSNDDSKSIKEQANNIKKKHRRINSEGVKPTKKPKKNNDLKAPKLAKCSEDGKEHSDRPGFLHSWEIDRKEIDFVKKIASGTYCTIYRAIYRNQDVAVKVLKQVNEKEFLKNYEAELAVISSFRSPDVVFFFGACLRPKPLIVLSYAKKGSLYDVLNDLTLSIDWHFAARVAMQTLRGLNSLHNWIPQIVHRDIKSKNILVDENYQIKICDFGLSRFLDNDLGTLCKATGTYAYIAPEVYAGNKFTTKSDIYAFGITLWELCQRTATGTYETPFSEFKFATDFQIINFAHKSGKRPSIPNTCPFALEIIINHCWHPNPDLRPQSDEIFKFFEEAVNEVNPSKWLSLGTCKWKSLPKKSKT